MQVRKISGFHIVIHVVMIISLLVWILPFLFMIAVSFSSPAAILNNRVSFWPVEFTTNAYETIFNQPTFFRAYRNTIVYTIVGTIIAMIMTICFAYPLSKSFLKGHRFVLKLVIFSMFFGGGLIPNYLLISSLGLTGTRMAMFIPFAINQFNLIILMNFFRGIPNELEEAALIDGLGYFGILRRIVIPLSGPALATIGLYYAVFFWNDWFNALIYLNTPQHPVMLLLRNIVNTTAVLGETSGSADKSTVGISIKAAVIITSTLPIIILYPFLQKYFVKGITLGAVKG